MIADEITTGYLTTNEVSKILGVSINTLLLWRRYGKLVPCGKGKRPLYKGSDIAALKNIKNKNTTMVKEEASTEIIYQLFDVELLKAIYKHLIKSRGANVKIVIRRFQYEPKIKVDRYETDEPITIPRFFSFEIREISLLGEVRITMRGELSYGEIMNRFDHLV